MSHKPRPYKVHFQGTRPPYSDYSETVMAYDIHEARMQAEEEQCFTYYICGGKRVPCFKVLKIEPAMEDNNELLEP